MLTEVEIAQSAAQFAEGKQLFLAYAESLGLDLAFQGFAEEMAALTTVYGFPEGSLLLARDGDQYLAAVGVRKLEDGVAELKRMYVLPACQGKGIGALLMQAAIRRATELGYGCLRLDTLASMQSAQALYHRYGFAEIPPYRYNPFPDAVFMERRLP